MTDRVAKAKVARAAGRLDEAAALYEAAAAAETGLTRAHRLRHAGEIRLEMGELDRAEATLEAALALYRRLEGAPAPDLANALRPLAMLREAQKRREDARIAWIEARNLYRKAGVETGEAECASRIAALGG